MLRVLLLASNCGTMVAVKRRKYRSSCTSASGLMCTLQQEGAVREYDTAALALVPHPAERTSRLTESRRSLSAMGSTLKGFPEAALVPGIWALTLAPSLKSLQRLRTFVATGKNIRSNVLLLGVRLWSCVAGETVLLKTRAVCICSASSSRCPTIALSLCIRLRSKHTCNGPNHKTHLARSLLLSV